MPATQSDASNCDASQSRTYSASLLQAAAAIFGVFLIDGPSDSFVAADRSPSASSGK